TTTASGSITARPAPRTRQLRTRTSFSLTSSRPLTSSAVSRPPGGGTLAGGHGGRGPQRARRRPASSAGPSRRLRPPAEQVLRLLCGHVDGIGHRSRAEAASRVLLPLVCAAAVVDVEAVAAVVLVQCDRDDDLVHRCYC